MSVLEKLHCFIKTDFKPMDLRWCKNLAQTSLYAVEQKGNKSGILTLLWDLSPGGTEKSWGPQERNLETKHKVQLERSSAEVTLRLEES